MDNKSAILYSKLYTYKALVNKTLGIIKWALARVEKPYIACSFGKDSAVMLHLIHAINADIPVRFIRWQGETEHIDNYDEVIGLWKIKNFEEVVFSRETLSDKRAERYHTENYDSFFVGLRIEESTIRRITIKKHGVFYKNKEGMTRVCPLADWKTQDIAAYVVSNNLPTLNSYLKQGFESRTASRVPRGDFGIREQFLEDLKQRDFTAYQNIILKFPEIK